MKFPIPYTRVLPKTFQLPWYLLIFKLLFYISLFTAPQVIEDDKPPKTEAIEAEISIEAPPISSPATAVVVVDEKPHQAEAGQPPVTPASSAVAVTSVTSEVIASNRWGVYFWCLLFDGILLKMLASYRFSKIKVHIFWEGHEILRNLHRGFDRYGTITT